jgi:hypothetical protein
VLQATPWVRRTHPVSGGSAFSAIARIDRENDYGSALMDIPTIVLLALIAIIAGLTIVIALAHQDMNRAVSRMDRSAAACERAADSCVTLADQVRRLVTAIVRQPPRETAE